MNFKSGKQIISAIVNKAKQFVTNQIKTSKVANDVKQAAQAKIAQIKPATVAKAFAGLQIADLGAQQIMEFPGMKEILSTINPLPEKLRQVTVYKIPGVGPILEWVNNKISNAAATVFDVFGMSTLAEFTRQAADISNDPKYYLNLDLHKSFKIPGAYKKTTPVNGTTGIPTIVVHNLTANPNPDGSAMIERVTQLFSLLKAVRGLSSVSYRPEDLYNYRQYCKLALHFYYSIKTVVKAATTFQLVQVSIGDAIIKAHGFDPDEVRLNLANYQTLLTQIHRFISNTLPMSGDWIKRLEYLHKVSVPDYSDKKVATFHIFSINVGDCFIAENDPTKRNWDEVPNSNANSYAIALAFLKQMSADINSNDKWNDLIADYWGAFGSAALWQDAEYPNYRDPIDLNNGDNDLNREQIKNAMYLCSASRLITVDASTENVQLIDDLDNARYVCNPKFEVYGTFLPTDPIARTYSNALANTAYAITERTETYTGADSTTNVWLIPDTGGVTAQVLSVPLDTPTDALTYSQTIPYTLHKEEYSEGEALEISQFKCLCVAKRMTIYSASNAVAVASYTKTHEYAVLKSYVYHFTKQAGVNTLTTTPVYNDCLVDDDLTPTESPVRVPYLIQLWTLVDWMPMCHITAFEYDSTNPVLYAPHDLLLCDFDSYGSLDLYAFDTSINYSTYSLYAPKLQIGNKRFDNLKSVYNQSHDRKSAG